MVLQTPTFLYNTEFFRPVYEKKVYIQECKYQEFAREGGQDTLPKKIE